MKVSFNKLKESGKEREGEYLYIYVANETNANVDVFFDDLKVSQTGTEVLAKTDYYPFGMVIEGLSYTAPSPSKNKLGYNGIEEEDGLGLDVNQAFYRTLDPTIGRWWQVDPKAGLFENLTPYNQSFNNPVYWSDPLGDCPSCDEFNERKQEFWNSMYPGSAESGNGYKHSYGYGGSMVFDGSHNTYANAYFGEKNAEKWIANKLNVNLGSIKAGNTYDGAGNLINGTGLVWYKYGGEEITRDEWIELGGDASILDSPGNIYYPGAWEQVGRVNPTKFHYASEEKQYEAYKWMLKRQDIDQKELAAYLVLNEKTGKRGVLILPWSGNGKDFSNPNIGVSDDRKTITTTFSTYTLLAYLHTHSGGLTPSGEDIRFAKDIGIPAYIISGKESLLIDTNSPQYKQPYANYGFLFNSLFPK